MSKLLQTRNLDWITTVAWVKLSLEAGGMRSQLAFELPSACASITDGICTHGGTQPCECRLVVFQVWNRSNQASAIVVHGDNEKSEIWVSALLAGDDPGPMLPQIQEALGGWQE